jgi:thiosulfate/3-mercaptopyruvate sulfurtransferase
MKMRSKLLLTGCVAFAAAAAVPEQMAAQRADAGGVPSRPRADSVLVSAAWLEPRLQDRDLVVIFAGAKNDYDTGHVPGARHLPSTAFTAQAHDAGHEPTLMTELPPLARLDSALEAIGVSNRSRIVIYGGATTAARLYVTLDHAGLAARTSILDGGMVAWREAGKPISQELPAIDRGALTLSPRADVIADLATIRSATNGSGAAILDARLPQFYSGASAGQMPRAGHIPTAKNLPYTELLTRGTTFRDIAALQALFTTAGVAPGQPVITYCHIGMQASVLYVAARAAGYDARMYDGSFDEWSRRSELPVVKVAIP